MSLNIITIEDCKEWDRLVKTFKNYDVYYLSGYARAFQLHGDGEPMLFYYENKHMRAINVVMKRDISDYPKFSGKIKKDTYFDLINPYGYGGFLFDGNNSVSNIKLLDDEYIEYCKSNGIISEFTRFHPILSNSIGLESKYDLLTIGKTISIQLNSSEYILTNLSSQNRNKIRKAEKSGVKIYWGRNIELIDEFINMYNATMDRDQANEYYYFKEEFYKSILYDLKYNFLIFYAVYQGKTIAMSIILFSNKQMHYYLSASIKEYLTYAPTNLLLYEAACWGADNGYHTLHLGSGLGGKEDSLYKFKKSFNKNFDNDFIIGKKIFDEEKYYELIKIRMEEEIFDENTSFFPIYRG